MVTTVLAVNPVIETLGQIGGIIICLFLLIFVIVAVVFNLAMAFGLSWVREKTELIKLLRPNVESVNRTTASAIQGVPPAEQTPTPMKAIATVPLRVKQADKKVEQVSDRVANAAIEFRARTVQVQTVARLLTSRSFWQREESKPPVPSTQEEMELKSPGLRMLMDRRSAEPSTATSSYDPETHTITSSQLRNGSR
ncbi:hypothetical protein [Tengunoibacter tsumagoiensis]|uniref:Uncharacterized protein n=1 Tax=Tengunoibacter tsumagoiensis TaxID=2014871 RepID=A0A402A4Q3_9CHLR|nr:hypothetical protein [Tengunoibacter tsumagoiensis]GCE13981.1 hypothetical protein KTT_38400 [Tengunoibacter tsumagoiensis]